MEDKKYSVVGQVTIGTDEYRDLIEGKLSAEKEASDYRSKFWNEESKTKKLTEKIEKLESVNQQFKDFLSEHTSVKDDFRAFRIRRHSEDEDGGYDE